MAEQRPWTRRTVRSDDPSLSDEANRVLTEELRASLGTSEVNVEKSAPDRARERRSGSPFVAALVSNRALIAISFATLFVVGAILALVTGTWWAVVLAAGVHAVGTLIVAGVVVGMTTETEHASPEAAARLEEEGVADPDRLLSERLEDYAGGGEARGAAEVLSAGYNERTADPRDEAAASAAQQRTTMTPAGSPGRPSGSRSAVAALPWWAVLGSLAASIVLAIVFGGAVWLAPAVAAPVVAGWIVLQLAMDGRREERAAARGQAVAGHPLRRAGDTAAADRKRFAPIVAVVVLGVIVFMVAMGFVAGYW